MVRLFVAAYLATLAIAACGASGDPGAPGPVYGTPAVQSAKPTPAGTGTYKEQDPGYGY